MPLYFVLPDLLKAHVDIVRLVSGESCLIQGNNSDVILHVPPGIHGAILANIHSNYNMFNHHIPRQDCLLGPICEYHLERTMEIPYPNGAKFRIQLPHVVRDIQKIRKFVRVRHGRIRSEASLEVENQLMDSQDGDVAYDIDDEHIEIHTTHFSGFIVTAECIKCCGTSANALLFGSLSNILDAEPLATLKVYFSSLHSEIKDFHSVSFTVIRELSLKMVLYFARSDLIISFRYVTNTGINVYAHCPLHLPKKVTEKPSINHIGSSTSHQSVQLPLVSCLSMQFLSPGGDSSCSWIVVCALSHNLGTE